MRRSRSSGSRCFKRCARALASSLMNVEKHTAAEAAPDAPERTAQTEKTALILAPALESTNSATLQACIRPTAGKRRRRSRKTCKQRSYQTQSAKRGKKRSRIRVENLSRTENDGTRAIHPRVFCAKSAESIENKQVSF